MGGMNSLSPTPPPSNTFGGPIGSPIINFGPPAGPGGTSGPGVAPGENPGPNQGSGSTPNPNPNTGSGPGFVPSPPTGPGAQQPEPNPFPDPGTGTTTTTPDPTPGTPPPGPPVGGPGSESGSSGGSLGALDVRTADGPQVLSDEAKGEMARTKRLRLLSASIPRELPKINRPKNGLVTVDGRTFEMGKDLYDRWQAAANRGVGGSFFTGFFGFPESLERVNADIKLRARQYFAEQDLYRGRIDSMSYDYQRQQSTREVSAMDFERGQRAFTVVTLGVPLARAGVGILGRAVGVGAEGLSAEAIAQQAIRRRVLANIAESAAARDASNFEIAIARESQVLSGYNADKFWLQPIPKGSIVYGGTPGQTAWYTNAETLLTTHLEREATWNALQVAPNPVLGYRPSVRAYRVLEDLVVPAGNATNNPALGAGGGWQYFIKQYSHKLSPIRGFNLPADY